jgi:hypothetical protein
MPLTPQYHCPPQTLEKFPPNNHQPLQADHDMLHFIKQVIAKTEARLPALKQRNQNRVETMIANQPPMPDPSIDQRLLVHYAVLRSKWRN